MTHMIDANTKKQLVVYLNTWNFGKKTRKTLQNYPTQDFKDLQLANVTALA